MTTRWMKKMAALLLALIMMTGCVQGLAEDVNAIRVNDTYEIAIEYIKRENYDKAMEYLDKALEICTEEFDSDMYVELHLKKGCVYTLRQEYEPALAELDEAIRVNPELSEPYLVRAQVYQEMGNLASAAADLEKYIELSGDTSWNEALAAMYLQLEDNEKAVESYRELAASTTDDPEMIAYNLAIYEINAGMYAEALESLQTVPANPEKFPALHYNTGFCHMLLGNYAEAVEAFTVSIETEAFTLDATYNRAVCNMNLQEFEPAIADFTTYIDTREAGAEEAAEEPAEETAEEAAEEPTEETAEETTEESVEEPAEEIAEETTEEPTEEVTEEPAEETETKTAKVEPDIAYYYRGVCYISIAKYDEAIADFEVCLEYSINENESRFNHGLACLQTDRFEEAKTDFTTCIDRDYMTDTALFYRAYTFIYLEDNEAALADLTTCIEHNYDLYNSYKLRAEVYKLLGDDDNYLADREAALDHLGE